MLFRRHKPIIVVSGLPRSGTSLMMQMLEAGSVSILTDHARQQDTNNPRGYYEYEPVKHLYRGEYRWLKDAQGKAVKVIAPLLPYLPNDYAYKVILMQRDMDEILDSQYTMLTRLNQSTEHFNAYRLREEYRQQLERAQWWTDEQITVDYNQLMVNPQAVIPRLCVFLNLRLDQPAMHAVIDPTLYRSRR